LQTPADRHARGGERRGIYSGIVPRTSYSRATETTAADACQERARVRRHSKPIEFADESALLSGNYFRALGKRVSRLPPPAPQRAFATRHRKDGECALARSLARSLAIDRDARVCVRARANDRMTLAIGRSRTRSIDAKLLLGAVPEIISLAVAERTIYRDRATSKPRDEVRQPAIAFSSHGRDTSSRVRPTRVRCTHESADRRRRRRRRRRPPPSAPPLAVATCRFPGTGE